MAEGERTGLSNAGDKITFKFQTPQMKFNEEELRYLDSSYHQDLSRREHYLRKQKDFPKESKYQQEIELQLGFVERMMKFKEGVLKKQ